MANPTAPPPFNPMYPSLSNFQQDPAAYGGVPIAAYGRMPMANQAAYGGMPMANQAAYGGVPMANQAAYGGVPMANQAAYGGVPMANQAAYGGVPMANQAAYGGVPMANQAAYGGVPMANQAAYGGVPMANQAAYGGVPMANQAAYGGVPMANQAAYGGVPMANQAAYGGVPMANQAAYGGVPMANQAAYGGVPMANQAAYGGVPMANQAAYGGVPMANQAAYGGVPMANQAAYGGVPMANQAAYGGVPMANQAAYGGVPMANQAAYSGVPMANQAAYGGVPMANQAAYGGVPMANQAAYGGVPMANQAAYGGVPMANQAVNPAYPRIPMTNPAVKPADAGIPVNESPVETSTPQKQKEMKKPAVPSSGLMAPYGYNIMDVFQEGNIIRLIPHGDTAPIKLSGSGSHIKPHGDYLHPENTFFRVKIPFEGTVQLSNYSKPKHHIAIDKSGNIRGDGKVTGDKSCDFKAHLKECENKQYVCLESVKYPGWFLSMREDGGMVSNKDDKEAQFCVQVEQWVTPRKAVLRAYGKRSIANKLKGGATIQLKGKNSNKYLRIDKKGIVDEIIGGDDSLTYFTFVDRGMGVVSLNSYQHGGHRIRISNCVLEGRGDPDPPADFYLKETRDGAVSFESATCPGTFLSVGKGAEKSTTFAVYHVDIDKHGKQESVKTAVITA